MTALLDLLAEESIRVDTINILSKKLEELESVTVDSMKIEDVMLCVREIEKYKEGLRDCDIELREARKKIKNYFSELQGTD